LYYLRTFLPEYRKSVRGIYHKLLKTINILNGTLIANRRVPVMNRLLENSPASPKREDTRQEQTPTRWIKTLHTSNLGGQCPEQDSINATP
jgi:hypothetical protein